MPRGDRGFLIAVIGFLILAAIVWAAMRPSYPNLPTSEHQKAERTEYSPGNPRCYPSRLNSLPNGEAVDERYRCEQAAEQHRLKSDDLVQQTRNADAAIAMVDLAYRQTLLGLAGAIFGLLTLIAAASAVWYAREAAKHSGAGTIEAKRSADAAQQVLQIEQKPFLTLKPVDGGNVMWNQLSGRIGKRTAEGGITFETSLFCEIKSSGRSAAILTGICRKWAVSERKIPPPEIDPGKVPADKISIPVGPDGIIMAANSEITAKPDPKHENSWLTFYGYLEFTDLAGEQSYISGFAFNYDPKSATRGLVTGRFTRGKYWYHEKKEA